MGMGGGAAGVGPTSHTVEASADRAFRILPVVFDSIGVPVALVEPAKKIMGNEGFKIRLPLGKTPLSRFIDCGQAQIGPNADPLASRRHRSRPSQPDRAPTRDASSG